VAVARSQPCVSANAIREVGEARRKDSPTVVNALIKNAPQIASELDNSLTWDRGTEMQAPAIHDATDIRSTSVTLKAPATRKHENTNGLPQAVHAKGTDGRAFASSAQRNGETLTEAAQDARLPHPS